MSDKKKVGPEGDAQIRWKCRRGMLELDIIFEKFYARQYDHLTEKEQQLFAQLLDEPDPVLYEWLLGHASAENTPYHALIEKIKIEDYSI